jgi:hypothetical protein
MNKDGAYFLMFVGFLITFAGVGGIEVSITDTELLSSMFVAIVGLLVSYCGMLATRVLDSYED